MKGSNYSTYIPIWPCTKIRIKRSLNRFVSYSTVISYITFSSFVKFCFSEQIKPKKYLFSNINTQVIIMGCTFSKRKFVVNSLIEGQDQAALNVLTELGLTSREIDVLYTAFWDMDADNSGYRSIIYIIIIMLY